MSTADLINGSFELLGGLFIGQSCAKLYRDKLVRGVSVRHMAYFMGWGLWNLYYYPSLDQWLSFVGGLGVVVTNTLYVGMIVYYQWLERRLADQNQQAATLPFFKELGDATD